MCAHTNPLKRTNRARIEFAGLCAPSVHARPLPVPWPLLSGRHHLHSGKCILYGVTVERCANVCVCVCVAQPPVTNVIMRCIVCDHTADNCISIVMNSGQPNTPFRSVCQTRTHAHTSVTGCRHRFSQTISLTNRVITHRISNTHIRQTLACVRALLWRRCVLAAITFNLIRAPRLAARNERQSEARARD